MMVSHTPLTSGEFRILTCTRPQLFKMTIQPELLERQCPLDNGRLERRITSPSKAQAGLLDTGKLRALPLEIIHMILNLLDLQSLTNFRAISWGSRALIDGVPQYQAVFKHAPNSLRALLSTNMAIHFTAPDLFEALCTQVCCGCGDFGPFLDLFTCHRYCVTCVMFSVDLLSIAISAAKRDLKQFSKTICALPTCLGIPGQYTESVRTYRRRVSLIRVPSIVTAAKQEHLGGQKGQLELFLPQSSLLSAARRMYQIRDGHGQNPYRFMPMVRIPALDYRAEKLEWGVSCQGCRLGPRDKNRGYQDWNTVYSAEGYLEHFQQCEVSQSGRMAVSEYIALEEDTGNITGTSGLDHEEKLLHGFLRKWRAEAQALEDL